jgi:phosphoribosyl 1,2-cyclic phosphodiesterase
MIFDAGSGSEGLSARMLQEDVTDFDLFFSHCHFDHIMGLPFLKPLYHHDVTARIYAGHFEDATTCREMTDRFMGPPYFPVTPEHFEANVDFRNFRPPDTLSPHPGINIATFRLNHPNGCVGYRIGYEGRSVCYITDTEHTPGRLDAGLVEFLRGSDIMVYDCMYTDAEFDHYRGYGHSTWEEGVRLCEAADVGQLVIFHHRPGRTDADLREIEANARARFPDAVVAATGLELTP